MPVEETTEFDVYDTLTETAEKVEAAQAAIREIVADRSGESWTARELLNEIAKESDWSSSVRSLAMWGLVETGELVIGEDLRIRAGELV